MNYHATEIKLIKKNFECVISIFQEKRFVLLKFNLFSNRKYLLKKYILLISLSSCYPEGVIVETRHVMNI